MSKIKLVVSSLVLLCLITTSCSDKTETKIEQVESKQIEVSQQIVPHSSSIMIDTPDSSCFSKIGYDDGDLYVIFRDSNSEYKYFDVPRSVYKELKDADSMGGYYNKEIKGVYDCERIS